MTALRHNHASKQQQPYGVCAACDACYPPGPAITHAWNQTLQRVAYRLIDFRDVEVPVGQDVEVCICGEPECSGICPLALYAVRQVIEFCHDTEDYDALDQALHDAKQRPYPDVRPERGESRDRPEA